ncbi:DUF1697 domain-containing protein [Nocardioides taihuensis]|uniref:DUF1697 domain-containing protein n=1 Tax=Nocardioides taihuensis TaxID=1835606 RepID=A0ABW0BFK3_9ACTN
MGRSVAFFRNLNLGQGWAPTRPQLVAAYEEAGASDVVNVMVNGTVVFTHRAPVAATRAVLAALRPLTGYDDVAVVRPAAWLRSLVEHADALGLDDPGELAVEVSFFDARRPLGLALPWTAPGGRLTVVAGDHRHAISIWVPGPGGSNATVVLQGVTGVRVTSRALATVRRVVTRL